MKTPKEKAKELVFIYYSLISGMELNFIYKLSYLPKGDKHFETAKECAIICIEEKIKYANDLFCFFTNESPMYYIIKSSIDRQIEIKQEIEKL